MDPKLDSELKNLEVDIDEKHLKGAFSLMASRTTMARFFQDVSNVFL